jgi:hypothetical protein
LKVPNGGHRGRHTALQSGVKTVRFSVKLKESETLERFSNALAARDDRRSILSRTKVTLILKVRAENDLASVKNVDASVKNGKKSLKFEVQSLETNVTESKSCRLTLTPKIHFAKSLLPLDKTYRKFHNFLEALSFKIKYELWFYHR